MLATAILLWSPLEISPRATVGVAVLNPATAAVWLSLSSNPALQAASVPDLLIRPLPVAIGTAAWFTALALATAKLSFHLAPRLADRLRWLLAASLGAAGLLTLGTVVL